MNGLEIKCNQGIYNIQIGEELFYKILYPLFEDCIKKYLSEIVQEPEPLFQKYYASKKEYGQITYSGIEKPEDYKKRVTMVWAVERPARKRRRNGTRRYKKGGRETKAEFKRKAMQN